MTNNQHNEAEIICIQQQIESVNTRMEIVKLEKANIASIMKVLLKSIDETSTKLMKLSQQLRYINNKITEIDTKKFKDLIGLRGWNASTFAHQPPSKPLEMTFVALCTIMNNKRTEWKDIARIVRGNGFIRSIERFQTTDITKKIRGKIRQQLMDKDKTNKKLRCLVCGYIDRWFKNERNVPLELNNLITAFCANMVETNYDLIVWKEDFDIVQINKISFGTCGVFVSWIKEQYRYSLQSQEIQMDLSMFKEKLKKTRKYHEELDIKMYALEREKEIDSKLLSTMM